MKPNLNEATISYKIEPVKYTVSNYNTPFIVNILNKLDQIGIPKQSVLDFIQQETAAAEESFTYAPDLLRVTYNNRIETSLFNLLWHKLDPNIIQQAIGSSKFNRATMQRLLLQMRAANQGELFPMRSIMRKTALELPVLQYTDDFPQSHPVAAVTTAAASPDGDFYFCEHFCQSLINYAHLKEVHPKSYYFGKGRDKVPEDYAYLEFLIAHEVLHYTNSDSYKHKYVNGVPNHTIINWATDFRSNNTLVRSGYEQLPLGLFSDVFNFDNPKFRVFNALYEAVKAEMDKLPKSAQDKVEEAMEKTETDDHKPGTDQVDGSEPGEGKPGEGEGKPTAADHDAHDTKQSESAEKGKEQADTIRPVNGKPTGAKQTGGTETGAAQQLAPTDIKALISWQRMLAKFVQSGTPVQQTTWSKTSRRAATTASAVDMFGAGAMKPGAITNEDPDLKICIVVDISGSMGNAATRAFTELLALIKKHFPKCNFYTITFDGISKLYRCNYARNTATLITDVTDTKSKIVTPLNVLYNTFTGGASTFSSVIEQANKLIALKFNILILSDSDLVDEGVNLQHISNLIIKNKRFVNIVLADKKCFDVVAKALPILPNNITHMTDGKR